MKIQTKQSTHLRNLCHLQLPSACPKHTTRPKNPCVFWNKTTTTIIRFQPNFVNPKQQPRPTNWHRQNQIDGYVLGTCLQQCLKQLPRLVNNTQTQNQKHPPVIWTKMVATFIRFHPNFANPKQQPKPTTWHCQNSMHGNVLGTCLQQCLGQHPLLEHEQTKSPPVIWTKMAATIIRFHQKFAKPKTTIMTHQLASPNQKFSNNFGTCFLQNFKNPTTQNTIN